MPHRSRLPLAGRQLAVAAALTGALLASHPVRAAEAPPRDAGPQGRSDAGTLDRQAETTPAAPASGVPSSEMAPANAVADGAAVQPAALQGAPTQPLSPEVEKRLRDLEETVRQLKEQLRQQGTRPADQTQVEKIVDDKLKKQKPLAGYGSPDGFWIQSPDGNFKLRLHGLLQTDLRTYLAEGARTGNENFFLRRVRPILEGTVYKYFDFRLVPDFGQGTTVLQDAYLDYRYNPQASFRAGKFKEPLSLERLQSAQDVIFVERSLANNLAPNRDVGFQLYGDLFKGRLTYQAAAFNGEQDSGNIDNDPDRDKDVVLRLFAQPWRTNAKSAAQGLGFGVAGTFGRRDGTPSPTYRTAGRAPFFTYAKGVLGTGEQWRVAPQLYYYHGAFGLMGEYLVSRQAVQLKKVEAPLQNHSFFAQASYVLTGEKNSYRAVTPRHDFDPRAGHWGAFEVAGRYSEVAVDNDFFKLGFADPAVSASHPRAYTLGLNWYLNRAVKWQLNWEHTQFDHALKVGPSTTDHEDVFLSNFQIYF